MQRFQQLSKLLMLLLELANLYPFMPSDQAAGYQEMLREVLFLERLQDYIHSGHN